MEICLRIIEAKLNNQNPTTRHQETQQRTSRPETNRVVSVSETPTVLYEGESSFTIQSLGARETAVSMVYPTNPGTGSDIHTALVFCNRLQVTIRFLRVYILNQSKSPCPCP